MGDSYGSKRRRYVRLCQRLIQDNQTAEILSYAESNPKWFRPLKKVIRESDLPFDVVIHRDRIWLIRRC